MLAALVLLCLNLWFVVRCWTVLKAVQDGLMLLAGWLDMRAARDRRTRAGGSARDL